MELDLKILLLTFYYHPDLCAGSFRNTALLKELIKQNHKYYGFDLITTVPTRYSSFSAEARQFEQFESATIHRVKLPLHDSGMLDQSKAFFRYAKAVISISKFEKYDLIYASSSRLMTAFLGACLSRYLNAPLYLDIRDLFVEVINDALPRKLVWLFVPMFSIVEKWTFSRATKINLVSEGFKGYFINRYPHVPLSYFTNGIDDEFLTLCNEPDKPVFNKIPVVLYAGNIGEGQGLHKIIPQLAKTFEGQLNFQIIGDGGRRSQLNEAFQIAGVKNVEIRNPVCRADLIKAYRRADILFLHLNNYDSLLKVIPSKIFEYAALGKPIWAGVSGYAAEFVKGNVSNAAVFAPCDVNGAIKSFESLDLSFRPRLEFVKRFSRKNIMIDMAADIIGTIGSSKK